MKTKPTQTRKEQLRQRAETYQSRRIEGDRYSTWTVFDTATAWSDGYRAALKDVRCAVGKSGAPAALVKLLRPMR